MEKNYTQVPTNYKKNVDWINDAYDGKGVTFADGFQKDGVQNAMGARGSKKWNNWGCFLSVVRNEKGTFVVIEDEGTVGLTGPNMDLDKVAEMVANGEELSSDLRLARFSSMFNSGNNTTGGGLFGAGKAVYAAASEKYTYYFDSLTIEGNYVANAVEAGRIHKYAFEGEEAKAYIKNETGLDEKKNEGTRVIIVSPKQDLVDAIENHTIEQYIIESYWIVLTKMVGAQGIFVNGVKVVLPEEPAYTNQYDTGIYQFAEGYRVKNLGIRVSLEGKNPWTGISYYRKGMKIGDVGVDEIPEKLKGKFWGFIEVDDEWEAELARIEDNIHYGVRTGKRGVKAYQNLKTFVNAIWNEKLIEWNYKKNKEHEDKRLRDELDSIADSLQELFSKMGYDNLGSGERKPDFDVRWQNISYPNEGSATVYDGDVLRYGYRITNRYKTVKKFEYIIQVVAGNEIIKELAREEIVLDPGATFSRDEQLKISKDVGRKYEENEIVLIVTAKDGNNQKRKSLEFYYALEKEDNSTRKVLLTLHTIDFPKEGSRRVDSDQAISNISYRIENKHPYAIKVGLKITVNKVDDGMPVIKDVGSYKFEIAAKEEICSETIEKIVFDADTFDEFLLRGEVELRARLVSLENNDVYEQGEKITYYNFRIFYNSDEKNGMKDSFEYELILDEEDYRRSYNDNNGSQRIIYINIGHPAFKLVENSGEMEVHYLHEQMLKQYVLLYLSEQRYNLFLREGEDISDLDPATLVDRIERKIENTYKKSLTGV